MCAAFSQMDNINFSRMSEQEVKDIVEYGTRHLEFCLGLYRTHMRNGLNFLHAHPASARSWQNEDAQQIMNREDVRAVVGTCVMLA